MSPSDHDNWSTSTHTDDQSTVRDFNLNGDKDVGGPGVFPSGVFVYWSSSSFEVVGVGEVSTVLIILKDCSFVPRRNKKVQQDPNG